MSSQPIPDIKPTNGEHRTDSARIERLIPYLSAILRTLGLDPEEDGVRDTPRRVATMLVTETFRGLNPTLKPSITLFENTHDYREMVLVKDIAFFSTCEHHLVPFFGKASVAYLPKRRLAGLSKLNRLVQYLAARPQTQERLTVEIAQELSEALETNDVAVALDATHLCIASRGVKDANSITRTFHVQGAFETSEKRNEFLRQIPAGRPEEHDHGRL